MDSELQCVEPDDPQPEILVQESHPILQQLPPLELPPIFLADVTYTFPDTTQLFTPDQQIRLDLIIILSRKVAWLSIIDFILISFILYYRIYYLILAIIFLPILGFFSSRKFNIKLSYLFLVYLALVIMFRILLLALNNNIQIMVIQLLIVLLEIYIFYMDIRFVKNLKLLSRFERQYLIGEIQSPGAQEQIPDNVAVKVIESPPTLYYVD